MRQMSVYHLCYCLQSICFCYAKTSSSAVTAKCTDTLSPPPSIQFSLVIDIHIYTAGNLLPYSIVLQRKAWGVQCTLKTVHCTPQVYHFIVRNKNKDIYICDLCEVRYFLWEQRKHKEMKIISRTLLIKCKKYETSFLCQIYR